jgi:hypothetical protein
VRKPCGALRTKIVAAVVAICCLASDVATAQPPVTIPPAGTVPANNLPPGARRFRAFPRNDLGRFNAEWFPSASGNESIAVVTGGINVIVDGLDDLGSVDIATDRLVIWTAAGTLDFSGESFQRNDAPLEFYMEGNIEFRQGDRFISATAMYYDVRNNLAEVLDAELLAPVPEYEGKIRVQAERLRQIAKNRFAARNARFTTSRMGQPGYWFDTRDLIFDDIQRPVIDPITGQQAIDPLTGQPIFEHERIVTGSNNRVYVEGVPILYWPNFQTNLEDPSFYLRRIRFGDDDIFGTQVQTEWNLYQLLGWGKGLPDSQWDLNVDALTKRGLGLGTTFEYQANPITGSPLANGLVDAWGIRDGGLDNLGRDRRALIPEKDYRGRFRFQHREEFDGGFRLWAQAGAITDRNFLEQYFEKEWDTEPDQLTRLAVQQLIDNRSWTIQGSVRINEFFTQTEWLPRADHYWLGQPLFGRLTWFAHSQAGYGKFRTASAPQNPIDAAKFLPMAWETSQQGERFATRQEIDLPFSLGPVNFVPYALGELAHWGSDLTGQEIQRAYGQVGLRTSLSMWRVNPICESRILNVHGLAHKVDFTAEFSVSDANQNFTAFPLYDQLDDDAVEAFRRRYPFDIFGGGAIPARFDERYYAIRSGLGSWVASPTTEMADDLTVFRLGMRHRWQTKRGAPGYQRIVDWITLDTNVAVFPRTQDNFGETLGLADYDMRWHVGDRVTLTSSGIFDFFADGQQLINMGAIFNRTERGNLYLGFRSLQGPIDSQVGIAALNYRMSPKYIASLATTYDFAGNGNIAQRASVTRIGESFLVRAGFSYDRSKGNVGASFAIEPRLFRRKGSNLIEGIHVPPAGALGLE